MELLDDAAAGLLEPEEPEPEEPEPEEPDPEEPEDPEPFEPVLDEESDEDESLLFDSPEDEDFDDESRLSVR